MAETGRPTVMYEMTLYKLEGAFADGASDELACFLANISPATLYNYQKEHPEFLERKKFLKDQTKFQAKKNIREAIAKGDLNMSTWYAERKIKEEFSIRNEHTGADGAALFKWQDDDKSNHNSVQTEKMDEGISQQPETMDRVSSTPPGWEDNGNP